MQTEIVIPCFNEAKRLKLDEIELLVDRAGVKLIFVNDGSTDSTLARLKEIRGNYGDRVEILDLTDNVGKGEAVRTGLNMAMQGDPDIVGYMDADFATPAREILRLLDMAVSSDRNVVMGARVLRLGSRIVRSSVRHYIGRFFATLAANILRMEVYDTQCGAKLFLRSELLKRSLETPFQSRWVFDVELIGRLHIGTEDLPGYALSDFLEVPLDEWIDRGGSKIRAMDMVRVVFELIGIGWSFSRSRRELTKGKGTQSIKQSSSKTRGSTTS
jgi:glycosyltransferase involved in cell wall biosynthesis|tara:strand:- start:4142 stop:4957 length:816 start_codon:yes stop_codon:yes gene_type:complete